LEAFIFHSSSNKQDKEGERIMKKRMLVLVFLPLLVVALAGVSYGWQGRMGGMGDSFGLVADESDFLIHPAKIAKGEGIRFYGDYRFTYTDVMDWDYNLKMFNPAGTLTGFYHYDTSGHEYKQNALLGTAFPLGPGRMGFFFTYDRMRGDYDGNEHLLGGGSSKYDLTKDLDNFALRLLYGLPISGFNLGGEVQLAYRQEENKNSMPSLLNYTLGTAFPSANLSPFQLPYDSNYWEALFKGSLERKVGPLDLEFTPRGGFIFNGDSSFLLTQGTGVLDSKGDVTGWRIGGDLWARYPLTDGLSLPFLVKVDYAKKSRDGNGPGLGTFSTTFKYPTESHEKSLHLEAGGGVDKEFGQGAKIAAGIYYNYLRNEYDLKLKQIIGASLTIWDLSDYPASTEHQVMLRLAGELELTPAVTLRMGLTPFYGWVREDFKFAFDTPTPSFTDDIPLDGYHWGIGASLGGTIKFKPITLEPFVNFGYQKIKLDGNGDRRTPAGAATFWDMDKSRSEWSIAGGLSLLFDL
jgi:hypothetical protein